MGAFYGDGNHTPGCLYDLTLKGENNDQITIFSPTGQKGAVNYVRIVDDGKKSGEAVIETMVSGAKGRPESGEERMVPLRWAWFQ